MHSGSSISPKHPAIPVSIGIASLVLEGRSSALDDDSSATTTTATATFVSNDSSVLVTVPVTTRHGDGPGAVAIAANGCSTGSDLKGGSPVGASAGGLGGRFRVWRPIGAPAAASPPPAAAATTAPSTSSLQECSLLAISDVQQKLACISDARKRINLKLQQLRSSGPGGSSKDAVAAPSTTTSTLVSLVAAERNDDGYDDALMYGGGSGGGGGEASFVERTAAGPKRMSWSHHEGGHGSAGQSSTAATGVIYSGFEKMNVLASVSPIKNHHHHHQSIIANSFINFSPIASATSAPSGSRKTAATGVGPAATPAVAAAPMAATKQRPREGPHCEQFLKKIGLVKPDAGGDEGSEHGCSYHNIHCLRWQGYFEKLLLILRHGETVCIDVFLGPENDTILLEQWTLKLSATKSSPAAAMTIQSLCAAIRSQLYFSQISAWTELIQNSLEPEIFAHPRIKKIPPPLGPVGSGGGSPPLLPTARLDILFRINKSYDSTARFNEKPIVHNFPDASVAENYVVQVCLKSLPRLDRIPGINAALDATQVGRSGHHRGPGSLASAPPCHEKGKHRCFREDLEDPEDELEEEEDEGSSRMRAADGAATGRGGGADISLLSSAAISHREKQLQKYRKRMLKREKKKKAGTGGTGQSEGAGGSNSNGSSSSSMAPVGSRSGSSSMDVAGCSLSSYAVSPMSFSSCSSSVAGETSKAGSPRTTTTPTAIGGSVVQVASCSNGHCSNSGSNNIHSNSVFTSSINSIQPPLYSSANGLVCDDRYHAIALNSKSTQTATVAGAANTAAGDWPSNRAPSLLPFVASVATQTECPVVRHESQLMTGAASTGAPKPHCTDCCGQFPAVGQFARDQTDAAPQRSCSQGPPAMRQEADHCSGGGSSGGANSDRHMQYFNNYSRTYDIINDNCDKRQPPPPNPPITSHHRAPTTAPSSTFLRPCFIVGGGDGYEGDEDEDRDEASLDDDGDGDVDGDAGSISNNSAGRTLQKGDLLLQAIQRTATLNGGQEGNRSHAAVVVQQSPPSARPGQSLLLNGSSTATGGGKHKNGPSINNNNYATQNNNHVVVVDGCGQMAEAEAATRGRDGDRRGHETGEMRCEQQRSECDTFSSEKLDLGDCRLCKRQKTKHNFKLNLTNLLSSSSSSPSPSPSTSAARAGKLGKKTITATAVLDCGSTPPGCRRTLSESLVGHLTIPSDESGAGTGHRRSGRESGTGRGMEEDGGVSEGAELLLSPGDSPMLSSSTGAMGAGGTVFSFEQMKCYRRAFSEDVIDTITSSEGARRHCAASGGSGGLLNGGTGANGLGIRSSEEDTTDDSGDNQDDEYDAKEAIVSGGAGGGGLAKRGGGECCGCHKNYTTYQSPLSTTQATSGQRVGNTSTPAANGGCKEPLYISCSETDCSVSTASSVSPHKKQILSCAAIACANGAPGSPHPRTLASTASPSGAMELLGGCFKPSPKINLNYVFALSPLARDDSGFTSGGSPATSTSFPATSPIAIDDRFGTAKGRTRSGGLLLGGNAAAGAATTTTNNEVGGGEGIFRYDFDELPTSSGSSPGSGTIKSKSAPIFPFSSPCTAGNLSPRFMRTAQRQQQQRSRYPSERSSIGSDEQLSDDELSYLSLDATATLNPAGGHMLTVSPGKVGGRALVAARSSLPSQMLSKVLNRNLFRFGRAPLLGTLEESLLQRRLSPKYQVADFKVLLGASGSFCPTQLTIPVASYFYELPGQHLTTPYVCELRLPRKGYSIPRTGTVQATLLNPLGTVVRMFVVPYDFRDMPAMSTTFIRQRILACDESSLQLLGKNIEQLSNAEQMKLLRYAIHLRFQTSRSGKLSLHTDIRLLISRRTDCDTAAAHAKNLLEAPNELKVVTIVPENPKFSLRIDKQ
ncbi:uncharacterized protein LOC131208198 [Anopheles bellator]|uniref:uncharacterized protein LOC131208198 n=1 Tax=Anopheles bellator TaxID=139047 RepID=UPI0026478628|nr:uncharacterized protein LOC131208198 [Anopheles bellator]